jgi:hypothetical protein
MTLDHLEGGASRDGDHEAQLRDPAHRDQDGIDQRQGRFAERVRRQWNVVALHEEPMAPADIPLLAQAIHQKVGGDLHAIEARLAEFERMEHSGAHPTSDPLVKPGEPA